VALPPRTPRLPLQALTTLLHASAFSWITDAEPFAAVSTFGWGSHDRGTHWQCKFLYFRSDTCGGFLISQTMNCSLKTVK
jgi:hypothetical protein